MFTRRSYREAGMERALAAAARHGVRVILPAPARPGPRRARGGAHDRGGRRGPQSYLPVSARRGHLTASLDHNRELGVIRRCERRARIVPMTQKVAGAALSPPRGQAWAVRLENRVIRVAGVVWEEAQLLIPQVRLDAQRLQRDHS